MIISEQRKGECYGVCVDWGPEDGEGVDGCWEVEGAVVGGEVMGRRRRQMITTVNT